MSKFNSLILAFSALALAACGGGGENAKTGVEKGKIVSAEKAKTADQAVDVYAVHMTRIADAIEAIDSEADAQKAAKTIAEASKEFEVLAGKFDGANKVLFASAFAKRAGELTAPQMRIGLAMQKLSQENPEYLEAIGDALQEMPNFQ